MPGVITHANVVPVLGEYGPFEQMSGGDPQGTYTNHWPPGAKVPRKISSVGEYTDIVLTRAYISGRDGAILERWRAKLNGINPAPLTCIKQFRNQLGIVEDQHTYLVFIKDIKTPDAKAGDNGIAEIQITFTVETLM